MSYTKAQLTVPQREDANGNPASGYTISSYIWDTSTPTPMYTSSAGAGSATSFTLNSLGEPQTAGGTACDIFLDTSVTYKIIIRDAGGVQVGPTVGPVKPSDGTATTITFLQSGTGAVEREANSKMGEVVSVDDFYRPDDDGLDYGPAVQRGIDYIATLDHGTLCFTAGKSYLINSQVTVCDNLTVWAYGARIIAGDDWAGLEKPMFKNFSGTEFTDTGTILASQNISFYGGLWDGQDTGVNGSTVADVNMHGCMICMGGWQMGSGVSGLNFKDLAMKNFAGAGIMLWKCSDICIANISTTNFFANTSLSVGAPIDCHECNDLNINNIRMNHTALGLSWHGIVVLDWDASSKRVTFSNIIARNLNGGDGISCEGNSVDNLDIATFSNIIIENCAGDGIGVDRCIQVSLSNIAIKNVGQLGIQATHTQNFKLANFDIADCVGAGVFTSAASNRVNISNGRVQEVVHLNASFQGHGIFVEQADVVDTSASANINNVHIKDVDATGIYVSSYGTHNVSDNHIFNAGRNASSSFPDAIVTGDGSAGSGIVCDNLIIGGATRYGYNSAGSGPSNLLGNKMFGTFGGGKYRFGWRGGISANTVLTASNLSYDYETNILRWSASAAPVSGRYFAGDTFEYLAPAAGGFKGEVCTTSGVIGSGAVFKTWGAVSA